MKTEAEKGGMQPQVKGLLEPPEAGRSRKNPLLELQLHSLWSFVPAAPGHSHTGARDMCTPCMDPSFQVTKGQDSLQGLSLKLYDSVTPTQR